MNRYKIILDEWQRLNQANTDLEKEYEGKIKGDAHLKRKLDILGRRDALKRKALSIGTQHNVCRVMGKRQRKSLKNPTLMVTQRFNLFFTDVSEEEVNDLVRLHVKNLIQYTVTFYKPGVILTTD
jgi:hypothetical protein